MSVVKTTKCKLCGHNYVKPCHGKDKICMNGTWVRAGKKMKVYNEMRAKQGFGVPSPSKPKRVRLEDTKPAQTKKARIRL